MIIEVTEVILNENSGICFAKSTRLWFSWNFNFNKKNRRPSRLFSIVEAYPMLWAEIFPSPFQQFPQISQRGSPRRLGK